MKAGAGDLTLADLNEEGAKLSSLNTRGQLAQTALSLATQRDQQVLQLLR
ncbi:flagellin [Methylobacterium ajmalii]|nr:flagellin [Methylobacterium ajmalii]